MVSARCSAPVVPLKRAPYLGHIRMCVEVQALSSMTPFLCLPSPIGLCFLFVLALTVVVCCFRGPCYVGPLVVFNNSCGAGNPSLFSFTSGLLLSMLSAVEPKAPGVCFRTFFGSGCLLLSIRPRFSLSSFSDITPLWNVLFRKSLRRGGGDRETHFCLGGVCV